MKNFFILFCLPLFVISCQESLVDKEDFSSKMDIFNSPQYDPCEDEPQEIDIEDYAYEGNHPAFPCYAKEDFINDLIDEMMKTVKCNNQKSPCSKDKEVRLATSEGIVGIQAGCMVECTAGGLTTFEYPCVTDEGMDGSFELFNTDGSLVRQSELFQEINLRLQQSFDQFGKPQFDNCENAFMRIDNLYFEYLACSCPTYTLSGATLPTNLPCSDIEIDAENLYHLNNGTIWVDIAWYCCPQINS